MSKLLTPIYKLRARGGTYQKVTLDAYIEAEKRAGVHKEGFPNMPSTGNFRNKETGEEGLIATAQP